LRPHNNSLGILLKGYALEFSRNAEATYGCPHSAFVGRDIHRRMRAERLKLFSIRLLGSLVLQ
jgi:hypothetical protein